MCRIRAHHLWLAVTLLVAMLAPTLAAAGFDCAKAFLRVDFVICRSDQALQAQSELSAAWETLQSTITPDRKLPVLAAQRGWIKSYAAACGVPGHGAVGGDPSGQTDRCVIDRIRRRTAELRAMVTGGGLPGTAVDGQEPNGAGGVSADAGMASGSTYPIKQLLHPTGGLKPLRLRVLDGRVVVNDPDTYDLQAFMRLVALGLRPGLIEEGSGTYGQPQAFASDFLPFSNKLRNLSGADEFQTQDNQRAFLAAYADHLRSLAPRIPFEFVSVVPYDLPTYDETNQGFALPRLDNGLFLNFNAQGVSFGTPFQYPKSFWSLAPGAGRTLLASLERDGGGHPRQVRLVAVFRAVAAEPQSMRLDLQLLRLSIDDPTLGRELYRFGEVREQAALAGKGFADLIRPPPGIRPWVLQSFDKLPLFDPAEPFNVGYDRSSQLRTIATLIAAGNNPGVIEADPIGIGALFLTDDVKRVLFSERFGSKWNGDDEFEQASSKQTFFDRYAPLIRQVAPKPPFRFVFSSEASLNTYDASRGGFPIAFSTDQLRDMMSSGGLQTDMQFSWPDVFWPIEPRAAHLALSALQTPGRPGAHFARSVRVAATISAVAIDPTTHRLQLRLDHLRVYTPDLSKLLYEIPVINDAAALSSGRGGTTLQLAAPVVFNDLVACVELIDTFGDRLPEQDFKRCWDGVAARDANFYQRGGSSAALATNDARRPFFPRNGLVGTAAERASFIAWARSYAAGIPDTVLTTPLQGSGAYDSPEQSFGAFPGSSLGEGGTYKAMIASEGLQGDQILNLASAYATPILFVLPNRVSAYGLPVPKAVIKENQAWNATAQTLFRLGRPRVTRDDSGKETLTINVTPLRTVVTAGQKTLAQRSYEDIARLDPNAFTNQASPVAARPVATRPIRLDAAVIDLMTASAVGERLSPEALTYMVVRRWAYENSKGPSPERRFFAFGKRAPTIKEALDLGPAFTRWATANTPPLPVDVTLSGPVPISTGQTTASWRALTCFSGSFSSLMQNLNQTMAANGDLADCRRHEATLNARERRQCAALAAVQRLADDVQPVGGECHSNLSLKFGSDPLVVSGRLSHDLPVPALRILGGKTELAASVTLTLRKIDFFDKPPSARDLLPDAVLKALTPSQPSDAHGEFVTLDMDFVGVRYLDPNAHSVVATLGAESGANVASVVHDFERATSGLGAAAHPTGVYGPDLVGVRLGMTFDQAEQAIRQHMDVGQVFQGARAFDGSARNGAIRPLTSGALFVSRNGHEMVALLDEPPAASKRVLAAWRRVQVPPDTVLPAETLDRLQNKYGPPKAGRFSTGNIMQWFTPPGARCTGLYQYGPNKSLAGYWFDQGKVASLGDANARWPFMPEALFDPMNNRFAEWTECGPYVTAYYAESRQSGSGSDQVDTMLTDIGPYLDAYKASRQQLQSIAAAKPPEAEPLFRAAFGPDMVGVRLGMSFAEAEAGIRRHMRVGRVFEGAASDAPDEGAHALPGTGKLFVSDPQDEIVAILDAPGAAGQVVATWRKVYSPLNIDRDLVARRSVEKYGQPTVEADAGRLMAWGTGPTACGGADASAFERRVALDTRWNDAGAPFAWHAVNGDDSPTMPVITASHDGIPPGQACGPRVRLSFRSEQGNPPMNVTETILSDPGKQVLVLQPPRQTQTFPTAVKF